MLHRLHPAEQSVWAQIHVCRVTDLEKISVRISKDEAPMPLSVVGSLFVFPLSFHLSQALLGVWPFGLFCCVYSSFHNMLDLIRVFYWVFYFPNLSVFVSSYVKMMTNRVIVLPWVGGLYWNCHVHLSVCDSVHLSMCPVLSRGYLLNYSTCCNQIWYGGTSSLAREYGKRKMGCCLQGMTCCFFFNSVLCTNDSFATKLSLRVDH